MDSRYQKYAEQNAPRYTSYPTAPHFTDAVNDAVFTSWLGALNPADTVSLYLHTPYCRQMCWYCGCNAYAAVRDEPVEQFVEAIKQEIARVGAASGAHGVTEIHWGGGTPNILSPKQFWSVCQGLHAAFDLSACERIAVEIDARIFTQAHAEAFAACGVNRASLGVQDFDATVQAAIGRDQPFEMVADAVAHLRGVGIEALSFDLMYGLPHQTLDSVRETVRKAVTLKPARVSVFGYAHVPWFKQRQRLIDEKALPDSASRFDLAEAIRETLADLGYVAIGYDHYALPEDPIAVAATEGALHRNFQGFVESECDVLIGLGPSAISTLPQGYAQNESEVGAWRTKIAAGGLATRRGRELTETDRKRRTLIMRLLCDFTIDLKDHGGVAVFADEMARLAPLAADGLVLIEGSRLVIPEAAKPFARIVAQVFDLYVTQAAARHSLAV